MRQETDEKVRVAVDITGSMRSRLRSFSRGGKPGDGEGDLVRTCRRLFAALVLRDLISEVRSSANAKRMSCDECHSAFS